MSNEYNAPWRFDGHGINDNKGERIAKVSFQPYEEGNKRNPLFDKYSNLIKEAPTMLKLLEDALHRIETDVYPNQDKELIESIKDTISDAKKGIYDKRI